MSTLLDVAKICGLNASTVSRALRNDPRIRPETRARVVRAAAELDYRPNLAARSLALGRTGNYWMLLPLLYNPVIQQETLCLSKAVRASDRDLMIVLYHDDPEIYKRLLNRLSTGAADGAFLVAPDHDLVRIPAFQRLLERGFPLVSIDRGADREPNPGCPLVTSDNRTAAAELTRKLIEWGADRIVSLFHDGNSVERARRAGVGSVELPEGPGNRIGIVGSGWGSVTRGLAVCREHHPRAKIAAAVFDGWLGSTEGIDRIFSAEQDFEQISARALEIMKGRVQEPSRTFPAETVVAIRGITTVR